MKIYNMIKGIGFSIILALSGLINNVDAATNWEPVAYSTNNQTLNYPFITNDFATKVGSTALGSEGIRRVGALGGYTLEEFLEDTATRGPSRDLPTVTITNMTAYWTSGDVYDPEVGYFHLNPGSSPLVNNAVNYAYWDPILPLQIKWTTGTRPPAQYIYLGAVVVSISNILHQSLVIPAGDTLMEEDVAFSRVAPSIIVDGLQVFPTGTGLTNITMSSGTEYHNLSDQVNHNSFNFNTNQNLSIYYHDATTNWATSITNRFPVGLWHSPTGMAVCDSTKWYRGIFCSIASSNILAWVLPDYEFADEATALAGSNPELPPGFTPYIPITYAYVFKGDEVALKTSLAYWIDQRFMIRRGTIASGGSAAPSLQQVLLAGADTGGILPNGMGFPVSADQATSKGYVDSTINNVNAKKAYVDSNGNDLTAQLESSILPFKTISAAMSAAGQIANETNRFLIALSPGTYNENVVISNYVGMRGDNTEATIINGTLSVPSSFVDLTGSEIALMTINSSNDVAIDIDCGADQAYFGVRSCFLISTYDNDATNKTVAHIHRGLIEFYATTYNQLIILNTNGSESVRNVQVFEHTTNPDNNGLSQFTSYSSSSEIRCSDTNDNINMMYTHDNLDSGCINNFIGGLFNVYLNITNLYHINNIRIVAHKDAIGRSLSMANIIRLYMNETNGCNFFMGWSEDGTGDNVAIIRNNHVRVVSGSSSNIWFGTAKTTNDNLRIYDTEIIQNNAFNHYPKTYTNLGSAGDYYINTPHQNGDQILGGALDMSLLNTVVPNNPDTGHVRLYAYTYAGLENPYFKDSSGNSVRLARDHFFNGYNSETTTLSVGEAVYVTTGLSPANTPVIKRANASDPLKMPCAGIVVQVNGIGTNQIGRVMRGGRTEAYFNTAMFASGDKLYVSATKDGGITNVAPSVPNISQQVGWCHIANTNGYMNVYLWAPDSLSPLTTNWVVGAIASEASTRISGDTNLQAQIVTETNRAQVAESGLQTKINTETNRATIAETNLQAQIISATNRTQQVNTNLQAQINTETNRAYVAETNLQTQINSTTNRVNAIEKRMKFWANNNGVLQNINNTTAKVSFTNAVSGYWGTYTGVDSRWVPGVSGVTVRIYGLVNFDIGNAATAVFVVRKNNVADSTVIRKRAGNAADDLAQNFEYVDVTTSSSDYYELWGTTSGSTPMLGTAHDNWWAGEVLQ